MAYNVQDLRKGLLTCQMGTPGGDTYCLDGKDLCLAPLSEEGKRNLFCADRAGKGTDQLGSGRCRWHGGGATRNTSMSVQGRYAGVLRAQMRRQYDEYAEDPALMDLRPELNVARMMLAEALTQYQDSQYKDGEALKLITHCLDIISKVAERIEKIDSSHVLTVATMRMTALRAVEVAGEFVDKERMGEFIHAWQNKVVAVTMGQHSSFLE